MRTLDELGSPETVLRTAAAHESRRRFGRGRAKVGRLSGLPAPTRLAVEMALHEDQERRALEGELWLLERGWKEAEEIAAISDSLLLPVGTEEFLEKHREPGAG